MEHLFQDLRFGSRILWKSSGLSATAVILIALVIGGNFSDGIGAGLLFAGSPCVSRRSISNPRYE